MAFVADLVPNAQQIFTSARSAYRDPIEMGHVDAQTQQLNIANQENQKKLEDRNQVMDRQQTYDSILKSMGQESADHEAAYWDKYGMFTELPNGSRVTRKGSFIDMYAMPHGPLVNDKGYQGGRIAADKARWFNIFTTAKDNKAKNKPVPDGSPSWDAQIAEASKMMSNMAEAETRSHAESYQPGAVHAAPEGYTVGPTKVSAWDTPPGAPAYFHTASKFDHGQLAARTKAEMDVSVPRVYAELAQRIPGFDGMIKETMETITGQNPELKDRGQVKNMAIMSFLDSQNPDWLKFTEPLKRQVNFAKTVFRKYYGNVAMSDTELWENAWEEARKGIKYPDVAQPVGPDGLVPSHGIPAPQNQFNAGVLRQPLVITPNLPPAADNAAIAPGAGPPTDNAALAPGVKGPAGKTAPVASSIGQRFLTLKGVTAPAAPAAAPADNAALAQDLSEEAPPEKPTVPPPVMPKAAQPGKDGAAAAAQGHSYLDHTKGIYVSVDNQWMYVSKTVINAPPYGKDPKTRKPIFELKWGWVPYDKNYVKPNPGWNR